MKLTKLDIAMGILLFLSYIFQLFIYEFDVRFLFPLKMMTVIFGVYWYLLKRKRYSKKWKRRYLLPLEWTAYVFVVALIYTLIIYQTKAIWLIGF